MLKLETDAQAPEVRVPSNRGEQGLVEMSFKANLPANLCEEALIVSRLA